MPKEIAPTAKALAVAASPIAPKQPLVMPAEAARPQAYAGGLAGLAGLAERIRRMHRPAWLAEAADCPPWVVATCEQVYAGSAPAVHLAWAAGAAKAAAKGAAEAKALRQHVAATEDWAQQNVAATQDWAQQSMAEAKALREHIAAQQAAIARLVTCCTELRRAQRAHARATSDDSNVAAAA
jgi:hypothetical protein